MQKLFNKVNNKKGSMTIYAVVIFLVICIMFSFSLSYIGLINQAKLIEENSQIITDSCIMKSSINIYDSVKNGENQVINVAEVEDSFESMFENEMNLVKNEDLDRWEKKSNMNNIEYWVTDLNVVCPKNEDDEASLEIQASFKVTIPTFFFDGKSGSIHNIEIPINVKSSFSEKTNNAS